MRRIILNLLLIVTLLCAALAVPQRVVHADSTVTTGDMINMMNGFRTGIYGYPALVESPALDSCAQWTAETMASIQATTHLVYLGYDGATARCSGFGFGGGKTTFVTENWAMHTAMTLDILASYWSDSAHMLPASAAQYTYVGAGIASADGRTYYVLQAGNIAGETVATGNGGTSTGGTTSGDATTAATADNSQYMDPVITSTPNYDGYYYHTVKYGQTLFDIALAYGVTLSYLKEENNLTSDSIYEGQTLKVMQAPTATVTPTATATPIYPTRTPTQPVATYTPLAPMTATPTPLPSLAQELPPLDRQTLGLLLVILSAVGLAVIAFFTFFKPAKPAPVQPIAPVEKPVEPAAPVAVPVKKKNNPSKAKQPEPETPASAPVKKKQPKVESTDVAPVKMTAPTKSVTLAEEAPVKKPRTTKKKTQE